MNPCENANPIPFWLAAALRCEPGKVANDTVEVLYVWPVPFNAAPPQQRR